MTGGLRVPPGGSHAGKHAAAAAAAGRRYIIKYYYYIIIVFSYAHTNARARARRCVRACVRACLRHYATRPIAAIACGRGRSHTRVMTPRLVRSGLASRGETLIDYGDGNNGQRVATPPVDWAYARPGVHIYIYMLYSEDVGQRGETARTHARPGESENEWARRRRR